MSLVIKVFICSAVLTWLQMGNEESCPTLLAPLNTDHYYNTFNVRFSVGNELQGLILLGAVKEVVQAVCHPL